MLMNAARAPFLLAALALVACEREPVAPEVTPTAPIETPTEPLEPTPAAKPIAADAKMKPHTSARPPTSNQMIHDQKVPSVSLEITSPEADAVLAAGAPVEVRVALSDYSVGKELGQHVHIILDNEPYKAHYDASEPYVFENVAPGTHTLRVFPARHYHLALKDPRAFRTLVFHVGEKSADFTFDPSKPYLTYSRPKGSYKASSLTDGLLLDFWVSNIKLGPDAKVVYGIDGDEKETTFWEPIVLPAPAPGKHTVTLKLVNADGEVIENGGYNSTTREITIEPT